MAPLIERFQTASMRKMNLLINFISTGNNLHWDVIFLSPLENDLLSKNILQ